MAIAVGQAAPDFSLKDQNQKDVKLSDYRGKNVVTADLGPRQPPPVRPRDLRLAVRNEERLS